jgi:hypothetical protein
MPLVNDSMTSCAHCGRDLNVRRGGHGYVTDPRTDKRVPVCRAHAPGQPNCYRQVVVNGESLGGRRLP